MRGLTATFYFLVVASALRPDVGKALHWGAESNDTALLREAADELHVANGSALLQVDKSSVWLVENASASASSRSQSTSFSTRGAIPAPAEPAAADSKEAAQRLEAVQARDMQVTLCSSVVGLAVACALIIALRPTSAQGERVAERAAGNPQAESEDQEPLAGPRIPRSQPCSIMKICSLTAMNLPYGFMITSLGLFVVPMEMRRLWPEHSAIALGGFCGLTGFAQLLGPLAGHYSDTYRSLLGRRRPLILIGVALLWSLTFALWFLSLQNLRIAYACTFLFHQMLWSIVLSAHAGLVPDLVPVEQQGMAAGGGTALILSGSLSALVSMALQQEQDYHMCYAVLSGLTVICCAAVCVAADEDSSVDGLAHRAEGSGLFAQIAETYAIDVRQHWDFFLLFITKTIYVTTLICRGYILYFIRDTFEFHNSAQDSSMLGYVSGTGEAFAGLAALSAMWLLDGTRASASEGDESKQLPARESGAFVRSRLAIFVGNVGMAAMWLGPIYVGVAVHAGTLPSGDLAATGPIVAGQAAAQNWMSFMICGSAFFGIAQGFYLAGDAALSYALLPDAKQASRYLGLLSLCSCLGGAIGGLVVGGLLTVLSAAKTAAPEDAEAGYALRGYVAIFAYASLADLAIAGIASLIRAQRRKS